jgi:deoxyribonuclease (pyrimidine dimer)
MVRINLISPKNLSDQHLIAEYDEILMLLAYVKRYPSPDGIPSSYCLGKGHIKFFKDKLLYLKSRHESIKKEMKRRGFRAAKTARLSFRKELLNTWKPGQKDLDLIKKRLISRIMLKPSYYRYCRKHMPAAFFISLIRKS